MHFPKRIKVDKDTSFIGFEAYKGVEPKYESWKTFLSNAYWSVDLK